MSPTTVGANPYSVTVTSAEGCSAIATGSVTVNALPQPTISGSTTVYSGQPISLTASPTTTSALTGTGRVAVTWTVGTLAAGASTTYLLTVRAVQDGVLTCTAGVTATSADGTPRNNQASASFSVPAKVCQGESYIAAPANDVTNVEWYRSGVSVGTGNSLTITSADEYSYTATTVGSACQTSSCSPIIIYSGTVPNVTLAASTSAICVGQSSVLSVSNCTGTVDCSCPSPNCVPMSVRKVVR